MKSRIRHLIAGAAVIIGLASSASAAMLSAGNSINFAGSAQFDTNSLSSATTVEMWYASLLGVAVPSISLVQSTSGPNFGLIADGSVVAMNEPWNIGSGVDNLWSVGGYTFDLTDSTVSFQNGAFLAVSGVGVITGVGIDPTPGTWYFTAQLPEADGRFSYSAGTAVLPTNNVPDGGSAFALLGLALGGMEVLRRRRSKRATA
jgi:hypothetical protein